MKHFSLRLRLLIYLLLWSAGAGAQVADFMPSQTTGCSPIEITFSDKSTGTSAATAYTWDFGDGKGSVLKDTKTTYLYPGVYTVTLTVKNGTGAPSSKSVVITIYASPVASYSSAPLTGCPCTDVIFNNTSVANAPGAYTSQWSFGDAATATTNNTKHLYCTPGRYSVALKVTNSVGCTNTRLDTSKVIIADPPDGSFTASRTLLCNLPDSGTFKASGVNGKAPYRYRWDFGDGSGMTALSPDSVARHTYTAGLFTVQLIIVDANGCTDTVTKYDLISAAATHADFSVPAAVCQGTPSTLILFENRSVPKPLYTQWQWSDGGGGVGPVIARNSAVPGTISVIMIDSFGIGCIDTVIKSYTIYPKPKPRFTYAPIYPCPAPATITFTNKSSGADSYTWIFGDGTTSTVKSPSHTYTWDSVFTVYMIARSSLGCLDTFRVRDTSKPFPLGYPNPFYDSSNSPVIIRVMAGNISIAVDSPGGCIPFVITPEANLYSSTEYPRAADTSKSPLCTFLPGYRFMPYWSCGPLIDPDAYPDEFVDPPGRYGIAGVTTYDKRYPRPGKDYYWDFGDGATSTDAKPSHTYTVEGVYQVKVWVTTDNGCTFMDTIEISCGKHPQAKFSAAPLDICIHDSVVITNQSSLGQGYTWRFGDGKTSFSTLDDIVFKHRYDLADTFTIILFANRYGCQDTSEVTVIVRPPKADATFTYSCDTLLKVNFADQSKEATSVLWRFGDGATSSDRNPSHVYPATGTYTVSLITYNNIYNCKDSIAFPVKLYIPEIDFNTPDTTICKGDSIMISLIPRTYLEEGRWLVNGSLVSDALFNLPYRFRDTGRYSVTYIGVDDRGCHDTFTRNRYIIAGGPVMKLKAAPLNGCAPILVNFADSSIAVSGTSIISRSWQFGSLGKLSGTATSPSYTFPAGRHTVTLIDMDDLGCPDTITVVVDSRQPKAAFTNNAPGFACLDKEVLFFDGSTGEKLSYQWDFGDGGTSTEQNPRHAYSTIDTFDVRLIIIDNIGCRDTLLKPANVKTTKPVAAFTMSDSVAICPPLFVNFKNTSVDAVSYAWDFDNGSVTTAVNPVMPFVDSGIYNITLVVTDRYGCTDTAAHIARVFGYNGALTYSPLSGCAPLTVNFKADLIRANVMIWDFADGSTESAVDNPVTAHTYTVPGAYVPRIILGDGKGCSSSSMGKDTIKVDAVIPVILTGPTCIGQEVAFRDSSYSLFSGYKSSLWIFEDSTISTSTDKNPAHTYDTSGSFTVTLVATNTNGCIDTLVQQITIHDLPQLFIADTVICLGDGVMLEPSGAVTYQWLADTTLSCTDCPDPVANPKVPSTYYFTGTDINGCRNDDTVHVGIKTKTELLQPVDTSVCAQTPVTLHVAGAATYTWTPSKGLSNAHSPDPVATLDTTTVFRIIGVEGSCIPDTVTLRVDIYPLPQVNAGPDQKVLTGTVVTLQGSGTLVRDYLWSPALNLSCADCPGPSVTPSHTTTYLLKGISEHGCVDSDDVTIVVFCESSQLFLPNTFTPNGDGENDRFYPQGKGLETIRNFRIYNRWGQLLYERSAINPNVKEEGWDGTFKGEPLNPDTFVYTLEAVCDNGEVLFWKGDVTLIK